MKKNVFYLGLSALLLIFSGFAFQSCDDDDDGNNPVTPTVGRKTIEIRVVDETGVLNSADVAISKNQTALTSIYVAGSYTMDVTNEASGTVYAFTASRTGYISSGEESVTLSYTDPNSTWSSYVVLKITKKSQVATIDPTKDNTITIPPLGGSGQSIGLLIPAGATGDILATLSATMIPTAASRGLFQADAPNGSAALAIIDFETNWTGNFLNGKMATVTFPLSQQLVNLIANTGLGLVFGTNSAGAWEQYPVTVNSANNTGTVSIPHFSRWYLTPSFQIDITITQTELETLVTGNCNESATGTFHKDNTEVPEFYKNLFGWTTFPNVDATNTEAAQPNKYWLVRGKCLQKSVHVTGLAYSVPDYTYFEAPVTFSSTAIDCNHSGGGGE